MKMDSQIILGRILQRLIDQAHSQVEGYNRFEFRRLNTNNVVVSREKGAATPMPYRKLIVAIQAYQTSPTLYDEGPSALRKFGITHITSPIFSLLHLLEKDVYCK
jgi:hypothetical protein